MDNETVYLPGKIRDRIQDLMKSRKVTQAELAARISCSESALSRFISGKTDKLGDESIIRIARVFEVSTDFLLGEVDEPDRKNYDISELGLSVEAARNLYTQKVNPKIVSYDEEWRMITACPMKPPVMMEWIPSGIILGLRMGVKEENLVVSMAREAGIKDIYKSIIDSKNRLNAVPVTLK